MNELEQPVKNADEGATPSSTPSPGRKRLLLIEDQAVTRLTLLHKLRLAGFDVDVAPNGQMALDKLRSGHPDAIFMDLLLPLIKGVEVIKGARRDPVFGKRPIYVCTSASMMKAWKRRAFAAGATKVFNKATAIDDVIAEVVADLMGPDSKAGPPAAGSPATTDTETSMAETPTTETPKTETPKAETSKAEIPMIEALKDTPNALETAKEELDKSAHSEEDEADEVRDDEEQEEPRRKNLFAKLSSVMKRGLQTLNLAKKDSARDTSTTDSPASASEPAATAAPPPIPGQASNTDSNSASGQAPIAEPALIRGQASTSAPASTSDPAPISGQMSASATASSADAALASSQASTSAPASTSGPASISEPAASAGESWGSSQATMPGQTPNSDQGSTDGQITITGLPEIIIPFAASNNQALPPTAEPITPRMPQHSQVLGEQSTDSTATPHRLQEVTSGLEKASAQRQEQIQQASMEAGSHRELLAKLEKEREELVARILADEIELNRARTALEREREERKQLEGKLPDAAVTESAPAMASTPEPSSQQVTSKSSTSFWTPSDNATVAAKPEETPHKSKRSRGSRIEQELANLRQAYNELDSQLTAEQRAAEESKRTSEDLEGRLSASASELERVKSELEKQTAERERLAADLGQQLTAAKAAAEQAETAHKDKAARCNQLEEELTSLRQVRDDLENKLKTEQTSAQELRGRNDELQKNLQETTAELKRVDAERANQIQERERIEKEMREELKMAKAATKQAETAWLEEAERNKGFEERLRIFGNELKEETNKQAQRFEQELTDVRRERDDLAGKLKNEQQALEESNRANQNLENRLRESSGELDRVKAESEKKASELSEQLTAAKAATEQAETAHKDKATRCNQLEDELTGLRQVRDDLESKLKREQEAVEESKRANQDWENRLRESSSEVDRVKAELEKQTAERERLAAELGGQLATARIAAEQADAAHKEKATQCSQLENELAGLRQAREEYESKLQAEQVVSAEFKGRCESLANQLQERASELERVKTEAASQAAERANWESEHKGLIESTENLGEELCQLREKETANEAELSEMDRRLREGVASLARATADLETERGERRRLEQRSASLAAQLQDLHEALKQHLASERASQSRITALEYQLREREAAVTRLNAELQKETADRQLADEQLRTTGDLSTQLRKYLSLFEEAKKVFKRRQDELESRLHAALNALRENQSRLEKENAERQRLEEALSAAQGNFDERAQRQAIELSRLESALQVEQLERKRMEGDAIQSRYASLDSVRIGRTLVNNLRRKIRQPVDNVMQSTRRLLELQLADEHKKLVEAVLENALLLQTNLEDTREPKVETAQNASEVPHELDEAV